MNALKLANEEELEIIKENYGKDNLECVNKIKKLFNKLRLNQLFYNLEENSYRQLNKMIKDLSESTNLPESAFNFCLKSIYRRIK